VAADWAARVSEELQAVEEAMLEAQEQVSYQ